MKSVKTYFLLVLTMAIAACHRDTHPDADRNAKACYEEALTAFDNDSVHTGEQLLNEAITKAYAEKDLHTLYLAQLRLAESLSWGNSNEALAMAKQALATYERNPDSERNHIIILDYIGTYASQAAFNTDGSYDEALAYIQRAYQLALASKDSLGTEQVSQTLTSLANIHWAMEDYPAALDYARQAEACAPAELLQGTRQVLARCLTSCDSLTEAEAVYRAMQPGDDLQTAYIIQSNLAKLALQRNDAEAAVAAFDSAYIHAEELYFKALEQKDDYYQTALREQAENDRLHYRTALQRRTLIGGIALVLLMALMAFYAVRERLRASEQRRLSDARLHEQQVRMQEQQINAQREQLRQRDGTVEFLKDFILQRSEVIQKLEGSAHRHVVLSAHEWTEVERTLDAIDSDRFARLRQRFPELNEEDVQLCILTHLGLSNRAIGNLYGISISAVQHRKLKLKKEGFGEDDPDIPFEQVVDNL